MTLRTGIDRLLQRERWTAVALFAILAFSLFRACPDFRWWTDSGTLQRWDIVRQKADNLTSDTAVDRDPYSHEAKLTYRLIVPIVMRVLHASPPGMLLIQNLCGALSLYLALIVAFKVTGDRITAFCTALAFGCGWPGLQAFHQFDALFYDAQATCLLLWAMAARNSCSVAIAIFAASWTDERGLAASVLVFLFATLVAKKRSIWRNAFSPQPLGVVTGMVSYAVSRFAFTAAFNLTTPLQGINFSILSHHLGVVPLALWTALGASWFLVLCAILILGHQRDYIELAALGLAMALVIVPSLMVWDLTRSLSYLFPVVFIALAVLAKHEPSDIIQRISLIVVAVAAVVPTYVVKDSVYATWLFPMPAQVLKLLFGVSLHWKS